MDRERNFWIVGGDKRQRALARLLAEDGHTVHTVALDGPGLRAEPLGPEIALAHCVILPLPVTRPGGLIHTPLGREEIALSDLLALLRPGQLVCGGMIDRETAALARARGLDLCDYYAREECMVANAVPTAEGAVQVAMEELPTTLHGSRVLVLGFGRVGKLTAHRMAALGARVTVSARDYADLAWAEAYGYIAERLEALSCQLGGFDCIVNTIPAKVLTASRLRWVDPAAFLLDLASAPGGVDHEAAQELGLRLLQAPGLPGRTAPVTAARAIRDAVYHIIWEREETP